MLYGLIFGVGLARCCYLLDLGGRLDWFVAGDFEHGVELGVEARFGFAKDASPLLARDGLTGGVTAGYRVVLGAGFTLEAQLALVVVLIVAAVLYVNGAFTQDKADIKIDLPKVEVPAPSGD